MKIAIIGTGYVGLVTGTCFAETGNKVFCVDKDPKKIETLKQGISPIYEPGLEDLLERNLKNGHLTFTTDLKNSVQKAEIIFIAVGTPSNNDGSANLQYVFDVAEQIGKYIEKYAVIVTKSTVPVGTSEKVKEAIQRQLDIRELKIEFDLVNNPEFLKQGDAVKDFMYPDRVIIGCQSEKAKSLMRELYLPFNVNEERVLFMDLRSSEMTKYVANAFLATKISFINEIANLSEILGADIESVRKGIGSDKRIGHSFIYAGCGYGGSCFPKDVKALIHMSEENSYESLILTAVEKRNDRQRNILFEKIYKHFNHKLSGLKIALWGLSFKPETDDIREAPSLILIEKLISSGAQVIAFDPVAGDNVKKQVPINWLSEGKLVIGEEQYDALKGADALVLVTEWKPFCQPDFELIKDSLKRAIIFDGRNQYLPSKMKDMGFIYYGIGRE